MRAAQMKDGQRVEVSLHRGDANLYYSGTVVDAAKMRVRLDVRSIVEEADIADWRRAPWQRVGAADTDE
jgi:hypothetical protein